MKVVLINGSPHKKGCTYTALRVVEEALKKRGIETEVLQIGAANIQGCTGCLSCMKHGVCANNKDELNDVVSKMESADAIVIGSPVYCASMSGQLSSFLSRAFFSGGGRYIGKLGAAVVACRRIGAGNVFDQINKYFTAGGMNVVGANGWNQVFGLTPEEVMKDKEGIQNLELLGNNMAYLLKCIDVGKKAGIKQYAE